MRISQVDPRMTKSDHFRTALLQAAPASYKPRSRNRRDQLTDESAEPAPPTEVPEPVSPEANESPTSPSTIGSTEEEHDGSQPNATEPPEEATPAATIAAPMPWSRSDMLPLLPPPLGGGNWTSNSCSLFLDSRLVAPHCLSSSVFWRFRVRRLWSSLCHQSSTVLCVVRVGGIRPVGMQLLPVATILQQVWPGGKAKGGLWLVQLNLPPPGITETDLVERLESLALLAASSAFRANL